MNSPARPPASGLSTSVANMRDATTNSAQSFISDLMQTSLPSTSVDGAKQALSLRTTTLQFTRFVHKAGPVFVVQDSIESIFRWQDPVQTLFCGCVWALVCLFPQLILLVPTGTIVILLLATHQKRWPPDPISVDNPYQESHTTKPPVSGQPPAEGSVDYFQNLQNIQELMGRVANLTDAGRQLVPYFNWSDPNISNILLQLSSAITIIISVLLLFGGQYIDMRYVFLAMGEASLLLSHPFSISVFQSLLNSPAAKMQSVRLKALAQQMVLDDMLPDEIIYPNHKGERRMVKEIVVFENERKGLDGSWSTDALRLEDPEAWQVLLDGEKHGPIQTTKPNKSSSASPSLARSVSQSSETSDSTSIGFVSTASGSDPPTVQLDTIRPPGGYVWLPNEDWQIDRVGYKWSLPAGVDTEGWAYTDADGIRIPAGGSTLSAAARRRKWYRRIVSVPTYQ